MSSPNLAVQIENTSVYVILNPIFPLDPYNSLFAILIADYFLFILKFLTSTMGLSRALTMLELSG